MSLVCRNDAAMLRVAHCHAVIVLYIGCLAEYVEDAGECLWDCNPIDETSPQSAVSLGFLGALVMRTTMVFMLVASASKGRGRHTSLKGLMLEGSGHMLVFTLMVMVSAGAGREGSGSSGCWVC